MSPTAKFDTEKIKEMLSNPKQPSPIETKEGYNQSFGTLPYDEKRLVKKAKESMSAFTA